MKYRNYLGSSFGVYAPGRREIVLATHDELVFFHELAHVAHEKLIGKLKLKQDWRLPGKAYRSSSCFIWLQATDSP